MENITDYSSSSWDSGIDCVDLTNNGLYIIFVGYLLPLLSPTMRNYGREVLSHIKNLGKVISRQNFLFDIYNLQMQYKL